MEPLGFSHCQSCCSVMRSEKQADTPLALLNKPSAQRGCSRSSSSTRLMMADTLCVLNVCVCVWSDRALLMTGGRWDITSCFVWAMVERKLQCLFVFVVFLGVCVCVLCVCCRSRVVACVSPVALFIRSPDVLIVERCQQSGHSVINGPPECIWTPVFYVSVCVSACTRVYLSDLFY